MDELREIKKLNPESMDACIESTIRYYIRALIYVSPHRKLARDTDSWDEAVSVLLLISGDYPTRDLSPSFRFVYVALFHSHILGSCVY
jgi:hypothetical protein